MATYRPADDVVHQELDGEAVLLHLRTGLYFGLNEVGAVIWNGLRLGQSETELAAEVTRLYEVETAQATADVARLLEELVRRQLVERRGP